MVLKYLLSGTGLDFKYGAHMVLPLYFEPFCWNVTS